jgi:hypothetical protein
LTAIGGQSLGTNLHTNLAVIAVVFCRNDRVAPGLDGAWLRPPRAVLRLGPAGLRDARRRAERRGLRDGLRPAPLRPTGTLARLWTLRGPLSGGRHV